MPILTHTSECAVCGQSIGTDDSILAIPAFCSNRSDPLFAFSDSVVHTNCAHGNALIERAMARASFIRQRTPPRMRACTICHLDIVSPDEYVGGEFFTDQSDHPLAPLNCAQFHRRCLAQWDRKTWFLRQVESLAAAWSDRELTQMYRHFSDAVNS